jgi:hypothetical protein
MQHSAVAAAICPSTAAPDRRLGNSHQVQVSQAADMQRLQEYRGTVTPRTPVANTGNYRHDGRHHRYDGRGYGYGGYGWPVAVGAIGAYGAYAAYDGYDSCYQSRRVWTPYGWQWDQVYVCDYPYDEGGYYPYN